MICELEVDWERMDLANQRYDGQKRKYLDLCGLPAWTLWIAILAREGGSAGCP